jgi:hypothetical protein
MGRARVAVAATVIATVSAGVLGGCARAIDGTPVATPGQAGLPVAAEDLLATTCRQYVAMPEPARRQVIVAIAEGGNQLVAGNPDLWVGVAAALCAFVDPGAPVRDVVTGGIR